MDIIGHSQCFSLSASSGNMTCLKRTDQTVVSLSFLLPYLPFTHLLAYPRNYLESFMTHDNTKQCLSLHFGINIFHTYCLSMMMMPDDVCRSMGAPRFPYFVRTSAGPACRWLWNFRERRLPWMRTKNKSISPIFIPVLMVLFNRLSSKSS